MSEYLVWWTDQADADAIEDKDIGIGYIRNELASRRGRNGRGRLWVAERLRDGPFAMDWDDSKLAARVIERGSHGGIVIHRNDARAIRGLPGMVTDMNLNIVEPTP